MTSDEIETIIMQAFKPAMEAAAREAAINIEDDICVFVDDEIADAEKKAYKQGWADGIKAHNDPTL